MQRKPTPRGRPLSARAAGPAVSRASSVPAFCTACEDRAATRMHMLEENRRLRKAKECLKKIARLQKSENDALLAEVERLREDGAASRDLAERLETRWAELLGKHQAMVGDHDRAARLLQERSAEIARLEACASSEHEGRQVAESSLAACSDELRELRESFARTSAERTVLADHVSRLLGEQETAKRDLDAAADDTATLRAEGRKAEQLAAASQGELVGERRLREQAEQERLRAEAALKQDALDRVEAEMMQRRLRDVEASLREAQAENASLQEIRSSQAAQLRESASMLDRQRTSLEALQRRDLGLRQ